MYTILTNRGAPYQNAGMLGLCCACASNINSCLPVSHRKMDGAFALVHDPSVVALAN